MVILHTKYFSYQVTHIINRSTVTFVLADTWIKRKPVYNQQYVYSHVGKMHVNQGYLFIMVKYVQFLRYPLIIRSTV